VDLAASEKPWREGDAVLRCIVRGQKEGASKAEAGGTPLVAGEADAVFFEVARENGELVRLIVRQPGGVEVEFRFENWRFDPPIPETMFHFTPPPGVAIVNGELADGKPEVN
jgi:Predicted periplasmic protein (DUF2092)